jgi:type IV pilus assembly protein PilY1
MMPGKEIKMRIITTPSCPYRSRSKSRALTVLLLSAWTASLSASTVVDETPPHLSVGAAPNVVVTVDFSRSMERGFLPDHAVFKGAVDHEDALRAGRRNWYSSPDVNTLYFAPNDDGSGPSYHPGSYADGTALPQADFNSADRFPYGNPNGCTPTHIDLGNAFEPIQTEDLGCGLVTAAKAPGDAASTHSGAYYHQYDPERQYQEVTVDPGLDPYEPCAPGENCIQCGAAFPDGPTADTPDECFAFVPVTDPAEQQRFANWYTYYRTRLLVVQTVLSRIMQGINPSTRVAFQDVSDDSGFKPGTRAFDALDAVFDDYADNQGRFYQWLFETTTTEGSNLIAAQIRAGEFVSQGSGLLDDLDASTADNTEGIECRSNVHLMLTDGAGSDDVSVLAASPTTDGTADWLTTNQDGGPAHTLNPNPFGVVSYSPADSHALLFTDNSIGTLADAVFYYWVRDLYGDSNDDAVPPIIRGIAANSETFDAVNFWNPNNDPATWQHLTFFAVGLGAEIDDLFHAGRNGRGGYYDASNPDALLTAFSGVLDTVSSPAAQDLASVASVASVAINGSGPLSDDTRIVQALTHPETWSGQLQSFRMSRGFGKGNCPDKPRGAPCEDPDDPYQTTRNPGAFPAPDERDIFTMANGIPVVFERDALFPSLSTTQQRGLMARWCDDNQDCDAPSTLASDNPTRQKAEAVIDWLRGEDQPAIDGSLPNPPTFRARETVLGDILSSGPLLVGPPRQLFDDDAYTSFKTTHKDRRDMVYVGANDGMLHAFDAATLKEQFAYLPEAIYPNLSSLSDPTYGRGNYGKKAFVDGPLSASDAKFTAADGDGGWHSVLVGGFGAGAQGVYALDITDPTPELAKDLVLWEFTDASRNGTGGLDGHDMGYLLSPPALVQIDDDPTDATDPTWVALVNNGYDNRDQDGENPTACTDGNGDTSCTISQTGNAVLYVLRLGGDDDTRILARMDTGVGSSDDPDGTAEANGLSEVSTLDEDGDLIADRAYAGDLFGNVWRFDLRNTNTPPKRLFHARNGLGEAQPITSRILTYRHPNGGHMLLFGTGRLLSSSDKSDVSVQTFYGIWDDDGAVYSDLAARSDLLQHAFEEGATIKDPATGAVISLGRSSTKTPVYTPGAVRGWLIDLKLKDESPAGERVLVAPQVRNGRVVFVSMIAGDLCSPGGSSWITALDALDGSRLDRTPFDYNRDGDVDTDDLLEVDDGAVVGSSVRVVEADSTGIYASPSPLSLGGGEVTSIVSTSDGDLIGLKEDNGLGWRTWLQR